MAGKCIKSLLVAAFSVFLILYSNQICAQENNQQIKPSGSEKAKGFDAYEVIFGHVLDAYEFHFLSYTGKDGREHDLSIPLPVILYSPQKGFSSFMSSAFHHGEKEVNGYK